VVGSVIYRVIIAVVLQLGLKSTDLKLLTSLMVAVALAIPVIKRKKLFAPVTRAVKRIISPIKKLFGRKSTSMESEGKTK
jgi:ABC-type uncharacterized transport system permease subunit